MPALNEREMSRSNEALKELTLIDVQGQQQTRGILLGLCLTFKEFST